LSRFACTDLRKVINQGKGQFKDCPVFLLNSYSYFISLLKSGFVPKLSEHL